MRLHSLHHVAFEGLGSIAAWATEAGHSVASTWMSAGEPLPDLDAFDALVVMGGPMSVHDLGAHPWLAAEKRFVRDAIERDKPVLGICLGSQLLAEALGGRVTRQPQQEIGWFAVSRVAAADSPLGHVLPAAFEAFHWHGEAFEIPPGGVRLATSPGGANQAFACGDRWLGLQFHLETTPEIAAALVDHCADDLAPGPFVQTAAEILSDAPHFERLGTTLRRILDAWSECVAPLVR